MVLLYLGIGFKYASWVVLLAGLGLHNSYTSSYNK